MALTPAEVVVGNVAYFDVAQLAADPRIRKPAAPTTRDGPFLCVEVVATSSTWTPLSWTERPERLFIQQAWRQGGTAAWQNGTPYLNDGAVTYRGDSEAFLAAASTADTYRPETRQRVSPDGVAAVLDEIRARGGGLL